MNIRTRNSNIALVLINVIVRKIDAYRMSVDRFHTKWYIF